jgi:hypothetical protein
MNKTQKIKVFGFLAFCGLLLWVAFYPGFMSNDSIVQFGMSKSKNFHDWHPPVMAWVWSVVGIFFPGPSGMLAVHLALVLIAVYLWWDSYKDKPLSWLIFLIPFLPWIINFAGVLWKDVGLAFSLLVLSGLAHKALTPGRALIAFILIFYAINLRHNAIFAAFPLLILMGFRWIKGANSIKAVIFSCATIYACLFLGGVLNYSILQAERTKPLNYVMVDDLAFLSIIKNESLLPRIGIDEIKGCATSEIGQNKLVGKLFCFMALPSYHQAAPLSTDLKGIWLSSILENPIAYFRFRIAAFSYLLRTPYDSPYYIWHPGIDENSFGLKQDPNQLTLLADKFVHEAANMAPFFFKPYWWLMFSVVLLIITFVFSKTKSVITARVLLVSAIFYISGYIPATPMADFRYIYWSVIATTISFIIIVIDWPGFRSDLSKRDVFIATALGILSSVFIYNHGRLFLLNVEQLVSNSLDGQRVIVGGPVFKNNLTVGKVAYEVKGVNPFFLYDVSTLGLSTNNVRWLEFVFSCVEKRSSPRLQFFWWGDYQEGAVEIQSATRELSEGVNLMPLGNLFATVELSKIRGIRFDLSNPSACNAINFENIGFIE